MLTLRSINLTDEEVDVKITIQFGYVLIVENSELIYEGQIESVQELLDEINKRSKRIQYDFVAPYI